MTDSQPIIPFARYSLRPQMTQGRTGLISHVLCLCHMSFFPYSLASNLPLPLTSSPQQTCFSLKFQSGHRIGVNLMTLSEPV